MTTATWRVMRRDSAGAWLAPMDYTDKGAAQQHIRRLDAIGAESLMQTYDAFTGQWTPEIKDQT